MASRALQRFVTPQIFQIKVLYVSSSKNVTKGEKILKELKNICWLMVQKK